jgi:ketosteroid isomerase-like protein
MTTPEDGSAPHRANADTAVEVVTAMAAGNLARLMELWSPDLRFHLAQSAALLVGGRDHPGTHDPIREGRDVYLASYLNAIDRIFEEVQPPEFLHVAADGDIVIPLAVIRARLRDGTPYTNIYCFPMRFEDGKVVEMWEVHDTGYAFPLFRKQLSRGEA